MCTRKEEEQLEGEREKKERKNVTAFYLVLLFTILHCDGLFILIKLNTDVAFVFGFGRVLRPKPGENLDARPFFLLLNLKQHENTEERRRVGEI